MCAASASVTGTPLSTMMSMPADSAVTPTLSQACSWFSRLAFSEEGRRASSGAPPRSKCRSGAGPRCGEAARRQHAEACRWSSCRLEC